MTSFRPKCPFGRCPVGHTTLTHARADVPWINSYEVRVECHGPRCPNATEILQLMYSEIEFLNGVRRDVRAPLWTISQSRKPSELLRWQSRRFWASKSARSIAACGIRPGQLHGLSRRL